MKFLKFLFCFAVLTLFLWGCKDDDPIEPETGISAPARSYDGKMLQDYFYLACRVTQTTPGFVPTVSARSYGYLGITAYEAVVHGIENAQSLAGQIDALEPGMLPVPEPDKEYNWALAVNAAVSKMLAMMTDKNLTEENQERIDNMYRSNRNEFSKNTDQSVVERSEDFGYAIADAIYEYSKDDGGHEAYLDPFAQNDHIPDDDYCWIPTGPQPVPMSPEWGETRSFIRGLTEASQPTKPHLPFSTDPASDYYAEAMDVYRQVTELNTEEERTITKYWADDPFETCTPAGHTFNIVTQLLEESKATLEKTAVGLGMMAIAEHDDFISCWKSKYDYWLIRPVSYIQLYIDPSFETVIGTPPFPAYTSGHASEIGSGAKIMDHLFGDGEGNYTFTDLSQVQFGFKPRTYDNFYEMADECAKSRFYGGIHYNMDNDDGLKLGFAVGEAVINQINWPTNLK